MALTWHPLSATHGSAALDNVLLFAARAPLTAEGADHIRRRLTELGRAFSTGLGHVYVIDHDDVNDNPDRETQQAYLDLIRHTIGLTRASVVILGGKELGPSAMRAMASTVKTVAHAAPPTRIYRTMKEGAGWLCEALRATGAHAPAAEELIAVGEELVQRVRAAAPPGAP